MNNEQEASDAKSDSELIDEVLEQVGESEVNEKQANEPELDGAEADVEIVDAQQTEQVSLEELQKQLKQAQKKVDQNWDKAVRSQAEMENLKRRTQKDLENAHKYGLEKFAKELLSVIDSLELGIQASTSNIPEVVALREGSELTIKQFENVFAKFNIEALEPIGQTFNPELHQAMSMQPSADVEPNTVINVLQKGYILNGRLIRPAMVVVSQAAKPVDDSDKPEADSINLDEQA
ncbi:MAG: nucleotide exchange factor GrpE [Methylococcaceae bacterium]|nr:nucleotide exchange factor GrpE [Methylococcaceae bacterium]